MLKAIQTFFVLMWKAGTNLKDNDALILASSTAFFCTFSISPIIIILTNILNFYFKDEVIQKELFNKLRSSLGDESTQAIETIVKNFTSFEGSWMLTVFGFVFLIFVATTLLKVIKQAINHLWRVKARHANPIRYNFVERSKSTILILFIGVLFLASFLLDPSIALLHDYFHRVIPAAHGIIHSMNSLLSLIIVTAWFTLLFTMLPDAKVETRVALTGALVTALLFNTGKWLLRKLLLYNTAVNFFGASTAFALILLFIFYSSLILYFGACFTYVFGEHIKKPILPGKYSDRYEIKVIGSDDDAKTE